jgi:hypothetical protein
LEPAFDVTRDATGQGCLGVPGRDHVHADASGCSPSACCCSTTAWWGSAGDPSNGVTRLRSCS